MERIEDILKTKYYNIPYIKDIRDLLYQSAKKFKNKYAFKLKNESNKIYGVTYNKFKNDVESLGTSLIELGLANKSIAVIGKNSYSWIMSYIASSIVGVVVPIDKELLYDDVVNFINVSECSAVIGDQKYLKTIIDGNDALIKKIKFINIDNAIFDGKVLGFNSLLKDGYDSISNGNTSFKDIEINPDDMHILLFTSGTTGSAKGICLSHKNICSNIMSVAKVVKVDPSLSVLSILPIHHTYECTLGQLLPLFGGGTISYCEGLKYINQNLAEFKPSFVICVPLLLENIQKKIVKTLSKALPKIDFSVKQFMDKLSPILKSIIKFKVRKSLGGKIRTFIVGAAAINPDTIESFFKYGIRTLQGYGLTECSPLVAGNNDFFYKYDAVRFTNTRSRIQNK